MRIVSKPLVSVVMPVYNGGLFLRPAIESILDQTYRNFELIIVDDGSEDSSWQIIQKFRANYPRTIKAYHLKKNQGIFQARNFGFLKTSGKYIAMMDADDISHPTRLEKQIEFMEVNPKTIVLGCQADIIDEKGRLIGKKTLPLIYREIYYQFAIVNPMIDPSCLIRRALLPKRDFLYRTSFGVNSDYQTFFEWLNYGEFANLGEPLLKYRRHSKNSSFRNLKAHFTNTLRIRLEACRQYNYDLGLIQLILILIQIPVVYLLPNKILSTVYTVLRDLDNPKNPWLVAVAMIRKSLFDPISGMNSSEKSINLPPHPTPSRNLSPAFQV